MILPTKRRVPLALAFAVLSLSCGKSAGDAPPAQPQPAANAPKPQPPQQQQQQKAISLVWGSGWSMRVRPVFSGEEVEKGDGTITVESWADGPTTVGYDLPSFTSQSAKPAVVASAAGVIRTTPAKGTITVKPDALHCAVFTPPVFWLGGETSAPGPLLWLPSDVTDSLRSNSSATMTLEPLASGLRMKTEPADSKGPVTLTVTGKGEVVIAINGVPTRLPAYKLVDDQGSTYTLLDSPENPLVLRFRFGPKPVVDGKKLVMAPASGYDVVSLSGPK
jgi:hypothetical protein